MFQFGGRGALFCGAKSTKATPWRRKWADYGQKL